MDVLQFVYFVFYYLCPFGSGLRVVERLPGNGLPYLDAEGLSSVFVHLVDQEEHRDIDFLYIAVADVGEAIEEVAVASFKIQGYHISLSFNAFGDERLLPG
jgi:hypothetical protein